MTKNKAQSFNHLQTVWLVVMGLCLASALLLHALTTVRVGFMSDDYALMHSARHGLRFWHLHASPPLEFFWRLTAQGQISAYVWHVAIFIVHILNVALFYLLARRWCGLDVPFALLAATLYALSAAGIEALAWTCAAGYVLTMMWILTALLCFLSWRQNSFQSFLKGIFLALMQLGALFTWEWGVLLFPALCVFAFMGGRRGWLLLIPVGVCWSAAVLMRSLSDHGVFWQYNDVAAAGRFLLGAPFLGLFPNLDKEAYFSFAMRGLFAAITLLLVWAARQQRLVLALLVCFFGAVLPWVKGGNPSSRYFYVAMPFLYLAIVLALARLQYQLVVWGLACLLLVTQFWSAYERAVLWVRADLAAHALLEQVETELATVPLEQKVVLVNVPEAYGPPQMPMRPQMWHCGFKEHLTARGGAVVLAKTDDSLYVWHRSPGRQPRAVLAAQYPESLFYEVTYDSGKFSLKPFLISLEVGVY